MDANLLARAESHVHIAGWYVSTEVALVREGGRRVLLDLLAELARKIEVRVLLWAGASLPLFRPSRGEVRDVADRLRAVGVKVALDAKERPLHCHHEKLVVVEDRMSAHPWRPALGWHDAAALVRGTVVADVSKHFRFRWHEVTGEELPAAAMPAESGEHELQLVQTIPEKVYRARPRGAFRILETYVRALRSAERLIYLESQFLWSPELVEILAHPPARPAARRLTPLEAAARPTAGARGRRLAFLRWHVR